MQVLNTERMDTRGRGRREGSVLVISLMMAAILGTLLASYLTLAFNQLKLSNNQHFQQQAQRLTETAMEQGLYALNHEFPTFSTIIPGTGGKGKGKAKGQTVTTSMEGADGTWTLNSSTGTATLTYTRDLGSGRTAHVTIIVDNYMRKPGSEGIPSAVTSETVIMDQSGNVISRRRITSDMEPRSLFPYGITASGQLRFESGTFKVRAYEPLTTYGDKINYHFDDSAVVGSGRLVSTGGNLDVFGRVITGDIGKDVLSKNSKIQDSLTPDPIINLIDQGLYHQGFDSNFRALTPPALTEENTFVAPLSWTTIDLGTPGTAGSGYDSSLDTYHYTIKDTGNNSFNVRDDQVVNIHGNTVIHIRDSLDVRLGGEIVIKPDASLILHIGNNLTVDWLGDVRNESGDPSRLLIVESNTEHSGSRNWTLGNQTEFYGGLYGQNVNLVLLGHQTRLSFFGITLRPPINGTFYGAAMVNDLNTRRAVEFNYDKNLFRNFTTRSRVFDDQYRFAPVNWSEQTPSDFLAGKPKP